MNDPTKAIFQEILDDMFDRPVMSNLARPHFVERLLVRALGDGWYHVGADWSGWDLEHPSRARIEVKQSAKRQSWGNRPSRIGRPTKPIFDIKERTGYFADGGTRWVKTPGRPADLYVFAWHDGYDPEASVDHRNREQWTFYLLSECDLPSGRKTVGLSTLVALGATPSRYADVGGAVKAKLQELRPYKAEREKFSSPALSSPN